MLVVAAAVGVQLLLLLLARSVQVKCVFWRRKLVSSALSLVGQACYFSRQVTLIATCQETVLVEKGNRAGETE